MLLQNKSRAAFWPQEVNIPERKCYCLFSSHGGFLVKVAVCFGKCQRSLWVKLSLCKPWDLYSDNGSCNAVLSTGFHLFENEVTWFPDVDYEKEEKNSRSLTTMAQPGSLSLILWLFGLCGWKVRRPSEGRDLSLPLPVFVSLHAYLYKVEVWTAWSGQKTTSINYKSTL